MKKEYKMFRNKQSMLFLAVCALLCIVSGCGGSGSTQVDAAPTGIAGRTIQEVQGGVAPGSTSDTSLPHATFSVRSADNVKLIMNVTSDANGNYQQSLSPGSYLLKPLDADLKGYYTPAVMVTVTRGNIANTDVKYYILAP